MKRLCLSSIPRRAENPHLAFPFFLMMMDSHWGHRRLQAGPQLDPSALRSSWAIRKVPGCPRCGSWYRAATQVPWHRAATQVPWHGRDRGHQAPQHAHSARTHPGPVAGVHLTPLPRVHLWVRWLHPSLPSRPSLQSLPCRYAGDRKRQNPREEKGACSQLCPPMSQLSSAFKSHTAHSLHTAWNTVDGKMSIKDCPIPWSEGPLSMSSRSSPAVCRHSASLRMEALKKPQRAQEPRGNSSKAHGSRFSTGWTTQATCLCAQVRGSWPCFLASPPNAGTRTTDQGLPWPRPPSPKGWCSLMAGSR